MYAAVEPSCTHIASPRHHANPLAYPLSPYPHTSGPPRFATRQNDSILYTAAGDHHVGVWDTHTAALRCYCKGHAGSVKAVVGHGGQPDVFASGASG